VTIGASGLKLRSVLARKSTEGWQSDLFALAVACLSSACSSKLVIASFACSDHKDSGVQTSSQSETDAGGDAGENSDAFGFPWATGFEEGFCDYLAGTGFCYLSGDQHTAAWEIVTSPVHSGSYAAKFTAVADKTNTNSRCVREGYLPPEAYYSVWYYVPAVATVPSNMPDPNDNGIWNLIHFQARLPKEKDSRENFSGLWDISLINDDTGGMRLVLYQFGGPPNALPNGRSSIPIGSWFRLRLYLKLTTDNTGEVGLWLNDDNIFSRKGFVTNTVGTMLGQWYTGNLADRISPPDSTVYVDDVSVGASL
jgi:hypothetical protein